jgi:hypothetical protein
VLAAATPVANGAYEWSLAGTSSYNPADQWTSHGTLYRSSNGSSLTYIPGAYPQFAINATPVPEPGTLGLIALCGLYLIWLKNQKSRE